MLQKWKKAAEDALGESEGLSRLFDLRGGLADVCVDGENDEIVIHLPKTIAKAAQKHPSLVPLAHSGSQTYLLRRSDQMVVLHDAEDNVEDFDTHHQDVAPLLAFVDSLKLAKEQLRIARLQSFGEECTAIEFRDFCIRAPPNDVSLVVRAAAAAGRRAIVEAHGDARVPGLLSSALRSNRVELVALVVGKGYQPDWNDPVLCGAYSEANADIKGYIDTQFPEEREPRCTSEDG